MCRRETPPEKLSLSAKYRDCSSSTNPPREELAAAVVGGERRIGDERTMGSFICNRREWGVYLVIPRSVGSGGEEGGRRKGCVVSH